MSLAMRWRSVSLWFLILVFSSGLLELGSATGWASLDVLSAINIDAMSWWHQPLWLHILAALLYAVLLAGMTCLVRTRMLSLMARLSGGLVTVLLASHLSPVFLFAPFVPLLGALLGLIIIAYLIRSRNDTVDPETLLEFLPQNRGDRLLWSVIVILILVAFHEQFQEMTKLVGGLTDFRMFYEAARALESGGNPYEVTSGGYFYPPTFAFFFRSLTWLPIAGASLLWFTLKLVLVFWTIRAVFRLVEGQELDRNKQRWLYLGTVLVAARFLLADLTYGNTNILILWLTIAAVTLDRDERPALAGLALAAAVSVKVVPVLFVVYFLARRRLPVLLWALVWLLALNLTPLLPGSGTVRDAWEAYLDTGVVAKLDDFMAQPDNQSLWGALSRLTAWSLPATRAVWAVLSLILIAGAAWVTYGWGSERSKDRSRQAEAASLFFLLSLLVSPGSWVVHYGAILLPMAFVLREALTDSPRAPVLWAVFIAANAVFTVSGWFRPSVGWSIEQSWFVAMALVLFTTLVGLARRKHS